MINIGETTKAVFFSATEGPHSLPVVIIIVSYKSEQIGTPDP